MNPFKEKEYSGFYTECIRNQISKMSVGSSIKLNLFGEPIEKARTTLSKLAGNGSVETKTFGNELWVRACKDLFFISENKKLNNDYVEGRVLEILKSHPNSTISGIANMCRNIRREEVQEIIFQLVSNELVIPSEPKNKTGRKANKYILKEKTAFNAN